MISATSESSLLSTTTTTSIRNRDRRHGESTSCLRISTDSKKKEFRLEDNGTPGMRQRGNGNKTLGHRDNRSLSLRGQAKLNGYIRFIDTGIFCAIGPS
jgi:hypothetical protein